MLKNLFLSKYFSIIKHSASNRWETVRIGLSPAFSYSTLWVSIIITGQHYRTDTPIYLSPEQILIAHTFASMPESALLRFSFQIGTGILWRICRKAQLPFTSYRIYDIQLSKSIFYCIVLTDAL